MQQVPQPEHKWLEQLVGEWTFESNCHMGPDGPTMTARGSETVRSFGGLWTIGEAESGDGWQSVMTLGYDTASQKYVGTFIATMMTHLWIYSGTLDDAGKVLTLDTVGPNFTDGSMVKYQDIIEIIDANTRTLTSQKPDPDGKWVQFMRATYTRKT